MLVTLKLSLADHIIRELQNHHLSRKLQISFFLPLDIFSFQIGLLALPTTLLCLRITHFRVEDYWEKNCTKQVKGECGKSLPMCFSFEWVYRSSKFIVLRILAIIMEHSVVYEKETFNCYLTLEF